MNRSPLHGIMGGVTFLQSTSLDAFQTSMAHSIEISGKTLLDTLNHIMDYSKITEMNGSGRSHIKMLSPTSVRVSSRSLRTKAVEHIAVLSSTFDLSVITEEVVEAVFASQSYRIVQNRLNDDQSTETFVAYTGQGAPGLSGFNHQSNRKFVLVILDIPQGKDWNFSMPVGAYRRIVMNLFGNALKYTETGYIKVSLKKTTKHGGTGETKLEFSVLDTGIGMSEEYLANHLFSAFSQENSFSSGVGLGLNIVRQITESLSGNIDLRSNVNIGTEISVSLSLPIPETPVKQDERRTALARIRNRMKGRSICILNNAAVPGTVPSLSPRDSGPNILGSTLASTLERWLGMSAVTTNDMNYEHGADIVICTEPSFDYLTSNRQKRLPGGKVPITIFIAIDAIEAGALRTDARVTSKESVVEIISQP
jgi:signal transduction histidine kinase